MATEEAVVVDEAEQDALSPPKQDPPVEDRVRVDDDSEVEAAPPTAASKVTELTPEERDQLRDLMTLGRRTRTFTLFEHKVTVCTLNSDDEIRVYRECKADENTNAYPRAYQTATVAAAMRTVDNESWENTLTENPAPEMLFQQKLDKARSLYPLVVQYIYKEVLEAEQEFRGLLEKLGKL